MTDEAKRCVGALRFEEDFECIECPIPAGNCEENCMFDVAADLIESISAELEQVKRERDAAIADMCMAAITLCNVCKHYHTDFPCGGGIDCDDVHVTIACSMFEWRGLQEK